MVQCNNFLITLYGALGSARFLALLHAVPALMPATATKPGRQQSVSTPITAIDL